MFLKLYETESLKAKESCNHFLQSKVKTFITQTYVNWIQVLPLSVIMVYLYVNWIKVLRLSVIMVWMSHEDRKKYFLFAVIQPIKQCHVFKRQKFNFVTNY